MLPPTPLKVSPVDVAVLSDYHHYSLLVCGSGRQNDRARYVVAAWLLHLCMYTEQMFFVCCIYHGFFVSRNVCIPYHVIVSLENYYQ